jgi:hypothetical protein
MILFTARALIVTLLITLTGCEYERNHKQKDAERRTCNEEQLAMVKEEVTICDSTSYMSSYCFNRAVINHCSIREGENDE